MVEISKKAYENLTKIIDKFDKEISENQFHYSEFISNYDLKEKCGTVCCIAGWMPKLFPNSGFYWEKILDFGNYIIVLSHKSVGSKCNSLFIVSELSRLTKAPNKVISYLFIGKKLKGFAEIRIIDNKKEVIRKWKKFLKEVNVVDEPEEKYTLS